MDDYDNKKDLLQMVRKYLAGKATPEETEFLTAYYDFFEHEENILERLREEEKLLLEFEIEAGINARIASADSDKVRKLWPAWIRIAAAAAILLFISIGGYFIWHKQTGQQIAEIQKNTPILPGGDKAILILSDGKEIVLSKEKNGKVAQQGDVVIQKTHEGQVVYNPGENHSTSFTYNTMVTKRGGQYHLTLADGTNVWLNSASSIKYPTAFTGRNREVEITGEAYFEVAHNPAKPFRVSAAGQTVEVLGTHFNINSYNDEPAITTTLLEGRVKITEANESALLIPGQQSQIANRTEHPKIRITTANTEEAVAWKNGNFIFDGENIESIMRKISRWYDVDIEYAPERPDVALGGTISRFENVSEILDVLQRTGSVHFKVEGRRIKVMK